ncbi:uncharacterized protein [Triticum aestivum]|uniref:uncharacterized protein n=1 Tax=Triticum aestivum TaxID=4565 RepID=UPI001D01E0DC|nr:uncharacterized protein LOC123059684 [Triticum aestivum]
MGVEIKSVRGESVQEGITSPFLVKVRLGEESSCHRITSLEALLNVKVSTKEEFKRKFEKLKVKRKKDKSKDEEDPIILKEEHKELTLKIQEMPKEGCAEVTSQRPQLSQSTRFRLVIENNVSRTIYKKETVRMVKVT